MNNSELLEEQLIENCLREGHNPNKEARAFTSLMELNGWNGKELAESLRVQPAKVSRTLSLLRLPDAIQKQVEKGDIPARTVAEISKLKDKTTQITIAKKALAGDLTNELTVKAVRQRSGKAARFLPSAFHVAEQPLLPAGVTLGEKC